MGEMGIMWSFREIKEFREFNDYCESLNSLISLSFLPQKKSPTSKIVNGGGNFVRYAVAKSAA